MRWQVLETFYESVARHAVDLGPAPKRMVSLTFTIHLSAKESNSGPEKQMSFSPARI
jgi:hypothetical protein